MFRLGCFSHPSGWHFALDRLWVFFTFHAYNNCQCSLTFLLGFIVLGLRIKIQWKIKCMGRSRQAAERDEPLPADHRRYEDSLINNVITSSAVEGIMIEREKAAEGAFIIDSVYASATSAGSIRIVLPWD